MRELSSHYVAVVAKQRFSGNEARSPREWNLFSPLYMQPLHCWGTSFPSIP